MEKGYFIHKLPTIDPVDAGMSFAFLRSRVGLKSDPDITTYTKITRGMPVGLYQFPKPAADAGAYEHSSILVQDMQNFSGGEFGEQHGTLKWAVLCALYLNSLTWIMEWVENIQKQAPSVRPVIYIDYDKWSAIAKGDDILLVAKNLLTAADLCITKFNVKAPILPTYCDKLYFWEYALNYVYKDSAGIECADELVSTTVTDDDSSAGGSSGDSSSNSTATGTISLMNSKITIENSIWSKDENPVVITVEPLEDLEEEESVS